ncbi:MAG: histidine phosphatase family protein [Pseudomonadota bacterium]
MSSIQIAFMRHAPTSWNKRKVYQGRNDISILDESRETLLNQSIPNRFADFDFYTSPLRRTQETLISLGQKDFKTIEALMECDFGDWEGLSYYEVVENYPHRETGYDGLHYKHHNGESYHEVQERVMAWVRTLKKNSFSVAHKGLMTAIYALSTNWDVLSEPEHDIDFKKIQLFEWDQRELRLVETNIELSSKNN